MVRSPQISYCLTAAAVDCRATRNLSLSSFWLSRTRKQKDQSIQQLSSLDYWWRMILLLERTSRHQYVSRVIWTRPVLLCHREVGNCYSLTVAIDVVGWTGVDGQNDDVRSYILIGSSLSCGIKKKRREIKNRKKKRTSQNTRRKVNKSIWLLAHRLVDSQTWRPIAFDFHIENLLYVQYIYICMGCARLYFYSYYFDSFEKHLKVQSLLSKLARELIHRSYNNTGKRKKKTKKKSNSFDDASPLYAIGKSS